MKKIILGLLAGTALSAPGLAWAQEESGEGFDEIVITAQKREEALQDVPISVAAVSGESVENYGIDSLEDLSYSVPNLTVTRTGIANRLSIRGIATGDNKGFEQSVATFVDGIYYGRDQLSRLPLVDLERVEVLRGPQPTLFGNNAVAGAISVITRRPGDEFEASLQALYEIEHQERQLTGVISSPFGGGFGGRVVAYYRDMEGFFENTNLNRDEPQSEELYIRSVLDYDNGGALSADWKIELATFETLGQPRENFGPVGNYTAVFTGPRFVDVTLDDRNDGGPISSDNSVFSTSLNADYDFGGHTLTSVTGYVQYNTEETLDVDWTRVAMLDGTNQSEEYRQISQEIRLTSPGGRRFDYIVGAYFQHSELDVTDIVRFNPFFIGLGGSFQFIGDTLTDRAYEQESTLWSAFAQGEFAITDALHVTVGARYNQEEKSGERTLDIVRGPLTPGVLAQTLGVFRAGLNIVPHAVSGDRNEESINPLANIQYDFTPDMMIYASFAQGTKAGGFDIRSNSLPTSPVPRPGVFEFEEETGTNYEVGFKYAGDNAQFNIAVFRTEYEDLQVNIFDGTINFNVRNAAEAITQGVEADARLRVTDDLTLSGSVAYLDFEYTDFPNGQCYFGQAPGPGGFCSYTGQSGALTPEWRGTLNIDYSRPIGNLEFGANLNADYSSSFVAAANLDPRTTQEAYTKVGARMSIGSADGGWELALIGRNLTDERILQTAGALPLATTLTGGAGVAYTGIWDRPRNIALSFSVRY